MEQNKDQNVTAETVDDGFDAWWQRKLDRMREMQVRGEIAERRARERRWTAPGKSTVKHPKYGSVVVPHDNSLAAIYNAMEYWKVPEEEHKAFIENVEVWEYKPGDGPLRRPREFCKGNG